MEGFMGVVGPAIAPTIAALLAAGATAFGAWLVFRGKKVDQEVEETKVEATATAAFLEGQVAFQTYVDGVVDERVKAAVESLQTQLTELAEKLAGVQAESHEMNVAVRSRETQLWLWNLRGRVGPMPEFPLPILERLGIGHLATSVE